MEKSLKKAYSEVDKILSFMENEYVEKVPKKLREIIKNEKIEDYEPDINRNIPLHEQNLEWKTYAILAMLHLNCWCNSEEEKKEIFKAYSNNDKKAEYELIEKEGLEKLFEKKETIEEDKNHAELIKYNEETILIKILNKIKNFFKKK